MKWVTRKNLLAERIACPWLIRKFIDPDAEIVYVAAAEVLGTSNRESLNLPDCGLIDSPEKRRLIASAVRLGMKK